MEALAKGAPLSDVFEHLKRPPEHRVAFTIAVIALGAKMAKADGQVTRDEISAFRRVFYIPKRDEAAAAKIYNVARQDVAGYQFYARRIAGMFRNRPEALEDLLEGLIYIAMADGEYHEKEAAFVDDVAEIFGISPECYRRIKARHLPGEIDPYAVLGVSPDVDEATLRRTYRKLVRTLHPDSMQARGAPEEARRMAEQRLASINVAFSSIRQMRAGRQRAPQNG